MDKEILYGIVINGKDVHYFIYPSELFPTNLEIISLSINQPYIYVLLMKSSKFLTFIQV